MAQSCNLFYTPKDARETRLHDPDRLRDNREAARRLIREAHSGVPVDRDRVSMARFDAMINQLSPRDEHRSFLDRLETRLAREDTAFLKKGIGNPHLEDVAPELLSALREICQHHRDLPPGLFTQGREKHTPTLHRLGHPDYPQARGFAGEILGTAAILRGRIPGLAVGPSDRLSFGEKAQTGANLTGGSGSLTVVGPDEAGKLVEEVLQTPKSATSESDLRISKPDREGVREIGVDFKWTSKEKRYLAKDELLGVLRTLDLGEVHEFHFVTNAEFGEKTKRAVEEINKELGRDARERTADLGPVERKYLDTREPGWAMAGAKIVLHEKAPI